MHLIRRKLWKFCGGTPRFFDEWRVKMPKDSDGRVLLAAGRTAAAEVEFRQALALEQRLAASRPTHMGELEDLVLALLDKIEPRSNINSGRRWSARLRRRPRSTKTQMALGMHEEVIRDPESHRQKRYLVGF
jgi:hypothetical protein